VRLSEAIIKLFVFLHSKICGMLVSTHLYSDVRYRSYFRGDRPPPAETAQDLKFSFSRCQQKRPAQSLGCADRPRNLNGYLRPTTPGVAAEDRSPESGSICRPDADVTVSCHCSSRIFESVEVVLTSRPRIRRCVDTHTTCFGRSTAGRILGTWRAPRTNRAP